MSNIQHTSETLATVVQRVAQGERQAFSELYEATCQKLFGIALRILKQEQLAEEILQEVYIKVWDKAADFDPAKASPITWLATITRNRALDEVRKKPIASADEEQDFDALVDDSMTPDASVSLDKELTRLENCLDGLESPRAEMIKSAYLEGFSRQELADKFQQPLGTIKTWLHRSIKQLQDCLAL